MAYNLIKSELMWWQLNEGSDMVRANVLHTFDVGNGKTMTSGQDLEPPLSDSAMSAYAVAHENKDTWDNDTVAAFASAQLGVTVVRHVDPEPEAPPAP